MYLHSRITEGDFVRIMKENRHRWTTGVIHSFEGSAEELRELLAMGLYIGISWRSVRSEENIRNVREIPLDKIILGSDCPYGEIEPNHASYKYVNTKFRKTDKKQFEMGMDKLVEHRQEPCQLV